MKKNTIITATALIAGAALVAYYFKKRRAAKEWHTPSVEKAGHHLTNIFARAKDRAMQE